MACAHVAGVAALILAKNPSFTPDQVRQALESTATDMGTPGRDDEYGWGLLNAPASISWMPVVSGVTYEVNCEPLGEVTIQLFEAGGVTPIGDSVISNEDGNYVLPVPSPGSYDVVASKTGFRNVTQTNVGVVIGVNTLDFCGKTGLIPNAPDMSYVLACVNHWLYPPSEECGLTMSKVLAVVNAWLYPV